jgi:hypothetical protein
MALSERRLRRLSHWQMTWHDWSREWVGAALETDALVRLTPDELAQMSTELQDVVRKWMEHGRTAEEQDAPEADRRTVFVFTNAFPLDDD